MKKRIIALFLTVVILLLPLSVVSFAGDIEEIFNSSFYFEIPDGYKFSWVYEETEIFDFNKEDGTLEYIYFQAQENNGQIENMEKDLNKAVDIFASFAQNSCYTDISTFSRKVVWKNGSFCVEIEGAEGYYYRGYLFANEEYIFCFLQEVNTRDYSALYSMIKSFEMNGTPLEGDKPENKVDFSKAVSYDEMISDLVLNYNVLDEQTNVFLKILCIALIIPVAINILLIVLTIRKKNLYKKMLEQYEKTFGVMSSGLNMYSPDYNRMNNPYASHKASDFNVNNYQNFDNQ